MAYFGTGGSPAQMAAAPAAPKYRISCGPNAAPAEAAAAFCEPVQRIRAMKGGSRNHDYILWVDRCQVTGSRGQCGHPPEWPVGDGGRCEMTTADTVAAQDVHSTVAPVNVADQNNSRAVCHPNARITERYNTDDHASYEYAVSKCAPEGVNEQTCETGWGKNRCQWGIPPVLEKLNPAIAARSHAIAKCTVFIRDWCRNGPSVRKEQCEREIRACNGLGEGSKWYK